MSHQKTINSLNTRDHFFSGKIVINQPKVGYRIPMDGCLLVNFICQSKPVQDSIEFGIGAGLIGIGIITAKWTKRLIGIEINKTYAELAVQNVKENGHDDRIEIRCDDLRNRELVRELSRTDAVIMNPPFWDLDSNQIPRNRDKSISGHEIFGSLKEWLSIASGLLKNRKSRVFFVYPAGKIGKCCEFLKESSLCMERIRFIHSYWGNRAELVMIEARRSRNTYVNIESPLFLKDDKGNDTKETVDILNGTFNEELMKMADRRKTI